MYLFDIDGTLLSAGGAGRRAINRVFQLRFGVEGAMDGVTAAGNTDDRILQECARNHLERALTRAELDEILDAYVPILEEEMASGSGFRVMPYVSEAIAFLAGSQPHLGIATGNIERAGRAKLRRADIEHHFAFGGWGCDSEDRRELVAAAIQRGMALCTGVKRADFVVVGDTIRDVQAARECGVRVVAVATGSHSPEELAASSPDGILSTLAELPLWHQANVKG